MSAAWLVRAWLLISVQRANEETAW